MNKIVVVFLVWLEMFNYILVKHLYYIYTTTQAIL